MLTGDFGPSLSAFPTPVMTIIRNALPWTAGLLILATLIAWILGNTLGALAGYFRSNAVLKVARPRRDVAAADPDLHRRPH